MSRFLLKASKQFMRPFNRPLSVSTPCCTEISLEKLVNDKFHEYETKSSGGKMVEPSPEILEELKKELAAVSKRFGFDKGADPEAWPSFEFEEPQIDPILFSKPKPKPKPDNKATPDPKSKTGSKPTDKAPPKGAGKSESKTKPKKDPKK